MENVFISELADADMLVAENEIMGMEVQRLIGECMRTCTMFAEEENLGSNTGGAISKVANFFKKIVKMVTTFIKKVIDFLLNIIKKPFAFIFRLFGSSDDDSTDSDSSGGSSSDSTTEEPKKITTVAPENVEPVSKLKTFMGANATGKNNIAGIAGMSLQNLNATLSAIASNISGTESLKYDIVKNRNTSDAEIIKERLSCLKNTEFFKDLSIIDGTSGNKLLQVSTSLAKSGYPMSMSPMFGKMNVNPKRYSDKVINEMTTKVHTVLMSISLLLNMTVLGKKVLDRVTDFDDEPLIVKDIRSNKMIVKAPLFLKASDNIINTKVIGDLTASYIMKNDKKIILSDSTDLFKMIWGKEPRPKIKNYTNMRYNPEIISSEVVSAEKLPKDFKMIFDNDTIKEMRDTQKKNSTEYITKALQDLKIKLDVLSNNTIIPSDPRKPIKDNVADFTRDEDRAKANKKGRAFMMSHNDKQDRLGEAYHRIFLCLSNFLNVARVYSTGASTLVMKHKSFKIYNSALLPVYASVAPVLFINEYVHEQYDKLSDNDKKEFKIPIAKLEKRIVAMGKEVERHIQKQI